MHSANYGFQAIANRYRHLFSASPPFDPPTDRLYDLDAIITARFGEGYAAHPKLRNLASLNSVYMPFFRGGKDEAAAADQGDYGLIERSTAEKAHIISTLLDRLYKGSLKTANSVGTVRFANESLDAVRVVLELGDRFVYVQRALRHRYDSRATLLVKDEYDAQDLVRTLLRLFFEDVRPEEWTPTHAGAAARIDFVLPGFGLAVELKYGRPSLSAGKLGEELIIDTTRYASRADVQHLVCLVFDREGTIMNPRGIESDLERAHGKDGLAVTVKIIDR
jgi:DpnII restriction endonuclease